MCFRLPTGRLPTGSAQLTRFCHQPALYSQQRIHIWKKNSCNEIITTIKQQNRVRKGGREDAGWGGEEQEAKLELNPPQEDLAAAFPPEHKTLTPHGQNPPFCCACLLEVFRNSCCSKTSPKPYNCQGKKINNKLKHPTFLVDSSVVAQHCTNLLRALERLKHMPMVTKQPGTKFRLSKPGLLTRHPCSTRRAL